METDRRGFLRVAAGLAAGAFLWEVVPSSVPDVLSAGQKSATVQDLYDAWGDRKALYFISPENNGKCYVGSLTVYPNFKYLSVERRGKIDTPQGKAQENLKEIYDKFFGSPYDGYLKWGTGRLGDLPEGKDDIVKGLQGNSFATLATGSEITEDMKSNFDEICAQALEVLKK